MPRLTENVRKEEFSILAKYEAFYMGGTVQFTTDGKLMLCMCGNEVKVINVSDGKLQKSITGEELEELTMFILAEDDVTLVTAAKNGILKQWNLEDATLMRTWKSLHIGKVACMAFEDTITLLATGGSDSTIKVWDIHQKYCTHNLKGAQGVFSVLKFQVVQHKLYLFGAADDCKIRVWDLDSSACISALEGHCSTVTGLLFLEEQNTIISCSRDKVIFLWDREDSICNTKPPIIIPVYEAVESIILAPKPLLSSVLKQPVADDNDIYFITAGDKGLLRIWNTRSAICVYSQESSIIAPSEDTEGPVISHACYIAAQNAFAVTTFEHNIVLYKEEDLTLLKQFVGYNDDILNVKFMGKEDNYLVVATNSPHIKVFELSTFSCQLLKGHSDIVVSLDVFQNDPFSFISGSKDNSIRMWKMDKETGVVNCISIGYGHSHSVNAVACSRGKTRFILSGSEDTTLKLWGIPKKIPVVALKVHLSAQYTVKAHEKNINSITVSTNDKLVATGSQDATAKIWDASDLSLVGTLRGHKRGIWCVTFSPVDLVVATSSGDKCVKIWSLTDFSVLKTFESHEASVLNVHFIARGTQLITSASDGLLKLWDIKSNECMKTFEGHDGRIWALAISANEELLVSGAADSNIIVWKDVTKEEKEKVIVQQETFIQREQELSNFMQKKNWREAIGFAIMLEQPFRALNIINEILLETDGRTVLEETVVKLKEDQIDALLRFAVEWNTNSRNCLPAQLILKTILKTFGTEKIMNSPERKSMVEALLPYSERHFHRLNRMLQDAHILSFLWQNMKIGKSQSIGNEQKS